MQNYLIVGLIIFFSVLLIYQGMNSVNILEGMEGSGCDCNQIATNSGNITTLQNSVKQNSDDIKDLKTTVNSMMAVNKK